MSNPNLILGLVVAVFGLGLYYTEYYDVVGREERAWVATRLLSFDPDKVTSLDFSNVGQAFQKHRKFSLGKNESDGSWKIKTPVSDKADKMIVETIIGHLYNLESARAVTAPKSDSDEYGFKNPRAIVKLSEGPQSEGPHPEGMAPESKNQKIVLGRRSPVDLLSYVQINDSAEVYLVNSGIDEFLTKTCSDLRKRKLFNLKNRSDIASMSIKLNGMKKLVLNQNDNKWSTDTSFPCPIDAPSADSIADAFRSLLVDFFVEEDPAEVASYGLDAPTASIKVKTVKGDELVLLIGKAAEGTLEEDPSREISGWYCKTNKRDTIYVIAEYQRKKLAKSLLDVRDRTVTESFEVSDIDRVSFVFSDKTKATALRKGSRWLLDPDGKSIRCDRKYMEQLIGGLSDMKAIGIASDYVKELYKVRLNKPDLVISLNNSLTDKELNLAIKWDEKGNLYIHNQSGPTSYVVSGELVSLFPEKKVDLLNRFPLRHVKPEFVKAVSIEAVAMETIIIEKDKPSEKEEDSWKLISPRNYKLDERQVAEWLIRLRSLPATSFLQEGKSGLKKYGLSTPLAKADITYQNDKEANPEHVLVSIGAETENKLFRYCMVSSMDAIFTIRKSIGKLFLAPSITYKEKLSTDDIKDEKSISSLYMPLETEKKTLPKAVIETSLGSISLILFEDEAPNHVANFIHLSENNFYKETTFHRVEGFCIQGGDPNTKDDDKFNNGKGDPGYSIKDEINEKRKNRKYYLAMAHKGPDTGGCQFFILKEDAPWLDGIHTVFGAVTNGGDIVDSIVQGTIIEDIHILNKRAHKYLPVKTPFN